MNAVPPLQSMLTGSFPGNLLGVESFKVVRGGEVKSIFSLGSGTKPLLASSIMTQLLQRARSLLSKVFGAAMYSTE